MSDQLPTPWPRRLLRLAGIVTATSLLVAAVTLAGLLPAAHRAMAAAEAAGGVAAPAGRLLARPEARSVVQAADGSVLAVLHGDQDRVVVALSAVPVRVRDAVLAAEDARYYQHGALDLRGIARAIAVDLTSGHLREGGSTIAQQYVKNVVTGDRRSLHRKLVEAVDAAALERTASKDRILAAYLNQVYFGDGVYGIATAAQHYFSRPVGKLSLAQAAALAGTIASPERFRPTAGREALARRNLVLDRMAAVGFASPARVAAAKRQPLAPRPHRQTVRYPYFVDDVTRTLLGDHALDAALGPAGSAARRRAVYEGGLRIRTTLRPDDQGRAETAVRDQLAGVGVDAALVSLDPATGAVVAMVGGHDFARSRVNLATGQGGSGFPPGSSFKVFYLVAALEEGIPTSTSFDTASPVTVTAPACPTGYTVHNAEPALGGRMALPQATAESVNAYYAQLMVRVGTTNAIRVARSMGITSPLHDYCSLVLGTENVTPLELAGAYATLANGGVHCRPSIIAAITGPTGRVLFDGRPSCRQAVDPQVAATAVGILRGVVGPGGTGFRAAIGRPVAGKTGTTSNNVDAWFTGFTPQLATSVWVGDAHAQVPMGHLFAGGPVFGGTFPALIFHDYMAAALAGQPVADLPGGPPGPRRGT
ncbi:MAG TPA: transglycosylase domain-containing protein [Actinomycetota bacterium]|jgi:membrane peptidoglycan carboxypeptidase